MVEHKIKLDKYLTVLIEIPLEMSAIEFKGLTMKANKLFNLSEVQMPTIAGKTQSGAPDLRGKKRYTEEEKREFVEEYDVSEDRREFAEKYGLRPKQMYAKVKYFKTQLGIKSHTPGMKRGPKPKQHSFERSVTELKTKKKGRRTMKPYTEEELNTIRRLSKEGKSASEIANKVGRLTHAIHDKIYRMKKDGNF